MARARENSVGWPPATVAIVAVVVVGAMTIAAIVRYRVDDVLRVWTGLSGIIGLLIGAIVTYTFTRTSVQQSQRQAQTAQASAIAAQRALVLFAGALDYERFLTLLENETVSKMLADPPAEQK
jgi:uncharacterized membrane protein HdeD (DUF308 family)